MSICIREFDYSTIKAIVLKSLEKLAEEEALRKSDDIIFDYGRIDNNPNNVSQAARPTPLFKLEIRNTTKYLNWRMLF
jgi:hypothetical protein